LNGTYLKKQNIGIEMESIKRDKITKADTDIADTLVKSGLDRLRACYQCGTCSGGCPSGRRTAMRTRSIIRKALIGDESVLQDDDIWMCSTCYTCYSRCPRDVPVTDIIIMLRNLATQKGYMKSPHKALSHMLIDTGHGVPIAAGEGGDKWRDLRKSYDLPPMPPTTHSHPESVDEIQTLIKSLKFDELVEYKAKEEEKKVETKKKAAKKRGKK